MARVEPSRRRFDRRAFLAAALGALGAPLAVRAQPAAATVHRIGILGNVPLSNPNSALLWGEFVRALRDLGHVDGQNVAIDYVSSDGQYERLPALATGLVQRKAEVIVAPAVQNVLAAKQATRTIPIVMTSVGDPVGNGLVASLARPGGNVTGTSFQTSATVGKQLELLKQIAPQASRLGVLLNPDNPGHSLVLAEARTSTRTLSVQVQAERVREPADLDRAFAALARKGVSALFIPGTGRSSFISPGSSSSPPGRTCRRCTGSAATSTPAGSPPMGHLPSRAFGAPRPTSTRSSKGPIPPICPSSSRRSSSSWSTSRRPGHSASRSGRRCSPRPTRSSSDRRVGCAGWRYVGRLYNPGLTTPGPAHKE